MSANRIAAIRARMEHPNTPAHEAEACRLMLDKLFSGDDVAIDLSEAITPGSFLAKFETRCPMCRRQVYVGDEIVRHERLGRFVHRRCS